MPKLELAIGDDDPALPGLRGSGSIQCQARIAEVPGEVRTKGVLHTGKRDVLVVSSVGLCRR
jgi:hypothetical protein